MKAENMAASPMCNMELTASIERSLNEKHCQDHLQVLKTFTSSLREQEFRDAVKEEAFLSLFKVLSRLSEDLQNTCSQDQDLESVGLLLQLLAECFRAQRNACVQNTRNQNRLRRLLSTEDEKTVNYASMVLHTCLDEAKVEEMSEPENVQLALRVMELCRTQPDLDWTVLIATQHFLKSSALVEGMYSGMSNQERVTLLELIFAQLREEDSEECGIPASVAAFLASSFQKACGAVLTLATGSASSDEVLQEALTVISLLDVLCEMTSDLKQFMFLQDHPDLLITTVELLKQVHAIGKASKNIFSSAQNFSSISGDGEMSSQSPVISFKAHLIRLIGNLCHNNPSNQDKVRELEGLTVILDNCNIDSNNPFISQWSIFAIRNLLKHNLQNQELVASLERQGTADYSALRALGFLVEERDGSLLLKPVRKDEC
ncbi:ataxin-10 isoform X2 [Halichoeres trimaculatus]|uniref:ataxin-10 isoform X2 n=1 Tax=Halichoeres trimaculatus TaxID=147232 RepID=UPI003D9E2032